MAKSEVKYGAILSYALILLNAVYGMIISPYLLSTIGESEYGVYKTIGALTASLSVLEFGLGGTLQRYIAKFNALGERRNASNFSAMGVLQAALLSLGMIIVGGGIFFTIDGVYSTSFTSTELLRAKQIFVLLVVSVVLHFFENVFFGIIAGYNRFIFSNSLKIVSLVLRALLYVIILPVFKNSIAVVGVTVALEVLVILIEMLYMRFVIGHTIRLYSWDKKMFLESFGYTLLLFVQSMIIQFNGNIDSIVIGAVIGTSAVTVYSFAIQLFNMYEQCATSISGVILPTVTNQIYSGATPEELSKTIVKYGRVQWMFLGAALFGFFCVGREFFEVWLGAGFEDCWGLSLILMVPVTFPLIVNTCLAILKARNMLMFRTVSMAYSVAINAALTIIGTRLWGYWAAAVGTAVSTIVGSIISMNIYYQKKLEINIFKLYYKIFEKSTPCMIIACVPCFILNRVINGSWISLIIKIGAFLAVYGVAMLLFGLNKSERDMILHIKERR